MKKLFAPAVLLLSGILTLQAQQRNELTVPNLDGYTTLKCDFHIHTVFSDGLVWPTVRVDEAYREGLDAIAITEHLEYRPHKKDVVADHNRSHEIAEKRAEELGIVLIKGSEITRSMAPGHFNALYLNDSNPLDQKTYQDAFKAAKAQNAFMFWNHPGWDAQQPDTTLWWPEHTELLNQGCMHGIEVANGPLFMPEAIDWCLKHNLTMLGNPDIHQPMQTDYDFAKGEHRTMTFVFAKKRSAESIREALTNRRTAVYYRELVVGHEEILRPLFEKCIEVKEVRRNDKRITLEVTNTSDLLLRLKKTKHDARMVYFRDMDLLPHTRYYIDIHLKDGITGGDCNFEVTNFLVASNQGLKYSWKI